LKGLNDLQLADQTVTLLNHLGRIFSVIQKLTVVRGFTKQKQKNAWNLPSLGLEKRKIINHLPVPPAVCVRYWSEELEVFFPRIFPSSTLSAKHLASCETKVGYQMETPMINSKNDCSFMLTASWGF